MVFSFNRVKGLFAYGWKLLVSSLIYAIALGGVLGGIISTFINAHPNRKLLGYSYKEQWLDIAPSLLLSLVMGAAVYSLKWLGLSALITLVIQVVTGAVLYTALAWLFKLESFNYLLTTMSGVFKARYGKINRG